MDLVPDSFDAAFDADTKESVTFNSRRAYGPLLWDGMRRISRADQWYYSFLPVGIAGGATSPLLALFAFRILGASLLEVGLVSSLTSVASVPAYILWGHLSDSRGWRRAFLVLGNAGTAVGFALMGLSRSLGQYYTASVIYGFLGAASGPVGTVLLLETSRRDEWPERLATFAKIGGVGWVSGLFLGALWLQGEVLGLPEANAMQGLFIISAALALLSTLLAFRWAPHPTTRVERRGVEVEGHHLMVLERARYLPMRIIHIFNPFQRRATAATRASQGNGALPRVLWLYLVAVGLFFCGFTAFYAIFPVFLLGFTDGVPGGNTYIFLVYVASQVTQVLLYTNVGHWVRAWGDKRSQLVATAGRVILFPSFLAFTLLGKSLSLPFIGILSILIGLHALVGICWALINVSGSSLVSRLAPPTARGEAQGIYNAIQGLGSIIGPLAGGFLADVAARLSGSSTDGFLVAFLATSAFIATGIVVLAALDLREPGRGPLAPAPRPVVSSPAEHLPLNGGKSG